MKQLFNYAEVSLSTDYLITLTVASEQLTSDESRALLGPRQKFTGAPQTSIHHIYLVSDLMQTLITTRRVL